MTATVQIQQFIGTAPGTGTDVTGVTWYQTTDDTVNTTGSGNPLTIPSSGSNYSYWRSLRLVAVTTPATAINNLKAYTDGGNSSASGATFLGQTANVGANAGYRQATGTTGTTGTALAQAALTITAATAAASVATFTVANSYSVNDVVVVAGVTPSAYNGTWTVASASGTQFTANIGSTPAAGSAFGTATKLNHTGLTTAPVDPFGWTSGSPLSLSGSIMNPSTGAFGDFLLLQAVIASTFAANVLATETASIAYDET